MRVSDILSQYLPKFFAICHLEVCAPWLPSPTILVLPLPQSKFLHHIRPRGVTKWQNYPGFQSFHLLLCLLLYSIPLLQDKQAKSTLTPSGIAAVVGWYDNASDKSSRITMTVSPYPTNTVLDLFESQLSSEDIPKPWQVSGMTPNLFKDHARRFFCRAKSAMALPPPLYFSKNFKTCLCSVGSQGSL